MVQPAGSVTLVTNDTALRTRAHAMGQIHPVRLPDHYLRNEPPDD